MKLTKDKIDKFKYLVNNKVISKITRLHEIILQTKESDLDKKFNRNFYNIFFDWVLDILQYGILLSITL